MKQNTMTNENPKLFILGINSVLASIIKSGRVHLGLKETLKAFRNGKVKSVIIAKNIPPHQKSTIEYWACIFNARIHHYNGNDWQLGRACGKDLRVQALSITDLIDANIIHLFGEYILKMAVCINLREK